MMMEVYKIGFVHKKQFGIYNIILMIIYYFHLVQMES
jgi:hypothetical protein